MTEQHPFKWRHFQSDLILLCVLVRALCFELSRSGRNDARRGLHVDHTTIYRWVQRYAPQLEKRCRPHLKACNDSWKVDETSIKVKKVWMYLYRAVDSEGKTLEFLLSPTRDAEAAKAFFLKALHISACSTAQEYPLEEPMASPLSAIDPTPTMFVPRVITVDKNAAYSKAIAELKVTGILPEDVELRHINYLNNLIEQDHRFIKRVTKPGMGFFSFETAWRTLQGCEIMNRIRKGQLQGVGKGDVRGQIPLIAQVFGRVAYTEQAEFSLLIYLLSISCNTTDPSTLHPPHENIITSLRILQGREQLLTISGQFAPQRNTLLASAKTSHTENYSYTDIRVVLQKIISSAKRMMEER